MKEVFDEEDIYVQSYYLNNMSKSQEYSDKFEEYSYFPLSPFEKKNALCFLQGSSCVKDNRERVFNAKIASLKERNNNDMLKCLSDKVMCPELLVWPVENKCLLLDIASMPVTDKNKQEAEAIVRKIRDMHYLIYTPDVSEAAYLAAKNNNMALLTFFKEQHVNMNKALESVEEFSPKIQQCLKDVKKQDVKVIDLISLNSLLLMESFLKARNIDVNTRDKNGCTLAMNAVKSNNFALLKYLANVDEVDWNAIDSQGRNVLMHALDKTVTAPEEVEPLVDFILSLPKDKFNIDYVNYCFNFPKDTYWKNLTMMPHTAFDYAMQWNPNTKEGKININAVEKIMKKMDISKRPQEAMPVAYSLLCADCFNEKFVDMLPDDDSCGIFVIKAGNTFLENMKSNFTNWSYSKGQKRIVDLVQKKVNIISQKYIEKIKAIYENSGELGFEQILKFVSHPVFIEVKNAPINIAGDRIVHFLADINVNFEDFDNVEKLFNLITLLSQRDVDFNVKNEMGHSAFYKAIEAENYVVARLLRECTKMPDDYNEAKQLANLSKNKNLIEIFEE